MPDVIKLEAEIRDGKGTVQSRRMRREQDKVPGVLYGGDQPSVFITLDYRKVFRALDEEAFYSQVLDLSVNGKQEQVVLRELQRNPATDRVIHIDFLRIREDRELQVSVPLHFLNERDCIGVRNHGGIISKNLTEIEVNCLPRDLPEFIEIDVGELDIGDSVHLTDLDLPDGVDCVALLQSAERDLQVVSVHLPRGAITEEEELEEEGEIAPEGEEDATPSDEVDPDAE